MTNLTSLRDVRTLLAEMDFHPSKALGQNFLIDRNILDIIIGQASLTGHETVLEIGPGLGVLTERLLENARHVTGIERDTRLFHFLKQRFASEQRLTLLNADALSVDLNSYLAVTPSRLIANLPYSVGSRILVEASRADSPPERVVVTVQEEVADRITAPPGTKDFGLLSVWLQVRYNVKKVHVAGPGCFWPKPAIQSAIVALSLRDEPLVSHSELPLLNAITRTAFGQRRKKLARTLMSSALFNTRVAPSFWENCLRDVGVPENARAENLSVFEWTRLTRLVTERNPLLCCGFAVTAESFCTKEPKEKERA